MNKFVKTSVAALALVIGVTLTAGSVQASGAGQELHKQKWSFQGVFGSFDRGSLKRGFQVYSEVCAACHSLNLISYRNLTSVGLTEDEIKEFASEFEVEDGPNDDGEMFMRPAKLSDKIVPPFPNEKAARASNNGAFPPDLSLMAKARFNGPDYIYSLLTGYHEEAPEGVELNEGMSYNTAFAGNQIAMAQPLDEESVEYEDGTKPTLEQEAKDLVTFLVWTASPEMEERKSLGIKVLLFLLVLTGMLYGLKRKIWADLH